MTDRANCGEIKLQHRPTAEMLGDYFTKPLQDALFTKFRDRILNLQAAPSTVPLEDHRSVLGQEQSHATAQSHGESHMPPPHNHRLSLQPTHKTMGRRTEQTSTTTNVHAVMTPMSQPLGAGT